MTDVIVRVRDPQEMTYAEYRREWGPGVCENAPLIELKYAEICLVCGSVMWFHGNPYDKEQFGTVECLDCYRRNLEEAKQDE